MVEAFGDIQLEGEQEAVTKDQRFIKMDNLYDMLYDA